MKTLRVKHDKENHNRITELDDDVMVNIVYALNFFGCDYNVKMTVGQWNQGQQGRSNRGEYEFMLKYFGTDEVQYWV